MCPDLERVLTIQWNSVNKSTVNKSSRLLHPICLKRNRLVHFRKRSLLKPLRIKSKIGCPKVDLLTEFHCNGFHPGMWNHIGPIAFHYLVTLFNVCLEQGIWPWSDSHVIFIRKTGKPSYVKPGTYRPITISSYIGKLLEKILSKRIEVH